MLPLVVYLSSVILGSSLFSLQSPKLYNDSGDVIETKEKSGIYQEKKYSKNPSEQVHFQKEELSELSAVLQEKAQQGSVLGESTSDLKKGPSGISDGLQTWLREDKGELIPRQVKTVENNHFLGSNGSSTQIVVYEDPAGPSQEKILSFSVNGTEQYGLSVGKKVEITKEEENKTWQIPAQNFDLSEAHHIHVATIRTEDVFGLTDVFFDGAALAVTDSNFNEQRQILELYEVTFERLWDQDERRKIRSNNLYG